MATNKLTELAIKKAKPKEKSYCLGYLSIDFTFSRTRKARFAKFELIEEIFGRDLKTRKIKQTNKLIEHIFSAAEDIRKKLKVLITNNELCD